MMFFIVYNIGELVVITSNTTTLVNNLSVLRTIRTEAHRINSSYEDSYTFKMIVFQFINYYGSIIYIAFFKGRSVE